MMLFAFLQALHIFRQVGCSPSFGRHEVVLLVGRPTAHERAVSEFWPGIFHLIPFPLPSIFVAIYFPLNIAAVACAAAKHLQEPLLPQALQI